MYFDCLCCEQLWDADPGALHHVSKGHATEIVCLSFDPLGTTIATGSMDNSAKLWDVETGAEKHTLLVCAVPSACAGLWKGLGLSVLRCCDNSMLVFVAQLRLDYCACL